jgi:hypothetical protein
MQNLHNVSFQIQLVQAIFGFVFTFVNQIRTEEFVEWIPVYILSLACCVDEVLSCSEVFLGPVTSQESWREDLFLYVLQVTDNGKSYRLLGILR